MIPRCQTFISSFFVFAVCACVASVGSYSFDDISLSPQEKCILEVVRSFASSSPGAEQIYQFDSKDVTSWIDSYKGVKDESPALWNTDQWAGYYFSKGPLQLTHSELDAIGSYQGSGYLPINLRLRNARLPKGTDLAKIDEVTRAIKSAITKFPAIPRGFPVFRGSDLVPVENAYYYFPNFLSTSIDINRTKGYLPIGGGALWTINLPTKQPGIKMSIYDETTEDKGDPEGEFLLPAGTWVKVSKVIRPAPEQSDATVLVNAETLPPGVTPDCDALPCFK